MKYHTHGEKLVINILSRARVQEGQERNTESSGHAEGRITTSRLKSAATLISDYELSIPLEGNS
jgi:hypothetical protein